MKPYNVTLLLVHFVIFTHTYIKVSTTLNMEKKETCSQTSTIEQRCHILIITSLSSSTPADYKLN